MNTESIVKHRHIAIVDNHPPILWGLQTLFDGLGHYIVSLTATSAEEFLVRSKNTPLDLVLVDLQMEGMDGFQLIAHLTTERTELRTVAISFSKEPHWIRRAIRAGASAYVTKDADRAVWREALDGLVQQQHYHSALVQVALTGKDEVDDIPARHLEFLRQMCDRADYTYDKIAELMGVTRSMVDHYFRYFNKRFGLHTRSALALWSLKHGLCTISAHLLLYS